MNPPAGHGPCLGPDEVHVWRIDLRVAARAVGRLARSLDPVETARAAAFRFPELRRAFVVAHAAVRQILAIYLRTDPADVRFAAGVGKPQLAPLRGRSPIEFNLSHSDPLALVAVSTSGAVGVDVERLRPIPDALDIARQNFAAVEWAAVAGAALPDRGDAFLRYWVRKEAYLKARGIGLARGMDWFAIGTGPGGNPRPVRAEGEPNPAHWWVTDLDLPGGFVGACVADRPDARVRLRIWDVTAGRPAAVTSLSAGS
jgi:4'-phosphopantetheinyl transferase